MSLQGFATETLAGNWLHRAEHPDSDSQIHRFGDSRVSLLPPYGKVTGEDSLPDSRLRSHHEGWRQEACPLGAGGDEAAARDTPKHRDRRGRQLWLLPSCFHSPTSPSHWQSQQPNQVRREPGKISLQKLFICHQSGIRDRIQLRVNKTQAPTSVKWSYWYVLNRRRNEERWEVSEQGKYIMWLLQNKLSELNREIKWG